MLERIVPFSIHRHSTLLKLVIKKKNTCKEFLFSYINTPYSYRSLHFQVDGLIPGHEYKFRVKAINKEGESEPLETFGSIIAKDPFSKYLTKRKIQSKLNYQK